MAHTPETMTTFTDWLKYKYQDYISETTTTQNITLKYLMPRIKTVPAGGKSVSFPVLYNSMGSVVSLPESDALPHSLPGNYDLATVPQYYHYFAICVSGQLLATSATNEDAFARAWAQEVMIKKRAFDQHFNRQMVGDGNGILAQVDGNANGQELTVDNAAGISGMHDSDINGAKFITPNMYVQARASGTAHDAGLLVTSLTRGAYSATSAVLTVSGTCSSVVDGDYLYCAATSTASTDAYGHEMPGLRLLIDDNTIAATVQSISATTYPEWRSQIGYGSTAGTAEALTTSRMMNVLTDIQMRGGNVDFIVTSPAVWHTYGNLCDQRNQVFNAKVYDSAYMPLNFNGIPVYMDPYCTDEMYFVDTRALGMYQVGSGPGWLQAPDSGLIMSQRKGASAAYDEFEAYWKWYTTMGITNRSWCGKLNDITVTVDKLPV